MHWGEEGVLEILKRKTEEVNYPLEKTDESRDILNSILRQVLSDSESEESIEES